MALESHHLDTQVSVHIYDITSQPRVLCPPWGGKWAVEIGWGSHGLLSQPRELPFGYVSKQVYLLGVFCFPGGRKGHSGDTLASDALRCPQVPGTCSFHLYIYISWYSLKTHQIHSAQHFAVSGFSPHYIFSLNVQWYIYKLYICKCTLHFVNWL